MRCTIVVLALAVFLSGSTLGEGMTLGITGGLNLATVTGDNVEENEIKTLFGLGGFLNIPLSNVFSVQPQILYMVKGSEFGDAADDIGMKLAYLDIPVLARVAIPTIGAVTPCLLLGPYVGLNMSAKAYVGDDEEDIKDNTSSTDFGLIFGAGLDYEMGSGILTFDARYALGLTDIDDTDDSTEVSNRVISIMVGYGFDL